MIGPIDQSTTWLTDKTGACMLSPCCAVDMTLEEMKTLSDAYKLELRSRKREPTPAVQEKVRFVCVCVCMRARARSPIDPWGWRAGWIRSPSLSFVGGCTVRPPPLSPPTSQFCTNDTLQPDLTHVYAASNDPREHGPGGKGKVGTVYTLSEAEYKAYFPGPWTKPSRVPFETGGWICGCVVGCRVCVPAPSVRQPRSPFQPDQSPSSSIHRWPMAAYWCNQTTGLNATLGTKHLLIRPAAVEVIGHLQAFAAQGQ